MDSKDIFKELDKWYRFIAYCSVIMVFVTFVFWTDRIDNGDIPFLVSFSATLVLIISSITVKKIMKCLRLMYNVRNKLRGD